MKKQLLYAGIVACVAATCLFYSCNKNSSASKKSLSSITTDGIPCIDLTQIDAWAAPFTCPSDQGEYEADLSAISQQKGIDSLINLLGGGQYPARPPVPTSPCTNNSYANVPIYGTSIANMETELGCINQFGTSTITLYVLENGPYAGGVFVGINQPGLQRAYYFGPNTGSYTYSYGCNAPWSSVNAPGQLYDASGLYYSVSVTFHSSMKSIISYMSNGLSSTLHTYNMPNYTDAGYATGIAALAGVTFSAPPGQVLTGVPTSYAYDLGQYIRTMTAPSGGSINLTGGKIPARSGVGTCN